MQLVVERAARMSLVTAPDEGGGGEGGEGGGECGGKSSDSAGGDSEQLAAGAEQGDKIAQTWRRSRGKICGERLIPRGAPQSNSGVELSQRRAHSRPPALGPSLEESMGMDDAEQNGGRELRRASHGPPEYSLRHTAAFWAAVFFFEGSILFATGAVASAFRPQPEWRQMALVGYPYFAGSLLYTSGAYLGYYDAINVRRKPRRFFCCSGASLAGYRVAALYLVGTICFNINCAAVFVSRTPPSVTGPMPASLGMAWVCGRSLGGSSQLAWVRSAALVIPRASTRCASPSARTDLRRPFGDYARVLRPGCPATSTPSHPHPPSRTFASTPPIHTAACTPLPSPLQRVRLGRLRLGAFGSHHSRSVPRHSVRPAPHAFAPCLCRSVRPHQREDAR